MRGELQREWLGILLGVALMGSGCTSLERTAMSGSNTNSADALDRAEGKIFRVNPATRSFEFLTETAFDPKTHEGRSRHTVYWDDQTRFTRVVRQNSFEGVEGTQWAHFRALDEENAAAAAEGRDFVVMHVTLLATDEDGAGLASDRSNLVVPFTADPTSPAHRGGSVELRGKQVGVRLRGPRAEVDIRTRVGADQISKGFWGATLRGTTQDDRFVLKSLDIRPQLDPRSVDDPTLPRILVVGDSISMNYHEAAREALKGIANYHRIDSNGGPSDRGVVCMELWLGDYTQEGLHWDVIQFNHGLHDLKQTYDEETGEYGTHQVSIEEYQENLEREIQIMKKTGATLVWCTTTPVPNNSNGRWSNGSFGRRKDEDLVYNRAALEVIAKHPEIQINDVNRFIRESDAFDTWRLQKDVHFWDRALQKVVGEAVAKRLQDEQILRPSPGGATLQKP